MGGKPPQPPIFFSNKSHPKTLRLTIIRALEGTTGKMGRNTPLPPHFFKVLTLFFKINKNKGS